MLLFFALALDALFGDPRELWSRVPHPVVLMGKSIGWLEKRFNRGTDMRRYGYGIAVLAGLIAIVWLVTSVLSLDIFFGVFEVLGAAILLAQRSLVDHVRAVAEALDGSLEAGREAVAQIVGRDVGALDEEGVSRAAIESAAENFSDGVVAPAFWFLIFGLPGIAVYKLVNTADSMIGHRTDRLRAFGWASARLDDVLNWIPARISAVLIATASLLLPARHDADILGPSDAFRERLALVWAEAGSHRSPNAGWPEAAFAGALDIALAGPRSYDGKSGEEPWLNVEGRHELARGDIDAAIQLLWRSWGVLFGFATLIALIAYSSG